MKRRLRQSIMGALVALLLGSTILVLTGCNKSAEQSQTSGQSQQYTCPHHPEVVQDKPGTCPKCNMKLVEKK
jgi:membrane fusion protein, copper/silver efflux system